MILRYRCHGTQRQLMLWLATRRETSARMFPCWLYRWLFLYCRDWPTYWRQMLFGNLYKTPCSGCFVSVGTATVFALPKNALFSLDHMLMSSSAVFIVKSKILLNMCNFMIEETTVFEHMYSTTFVFVTGSWLRLLRSKFIWLLGDLHKNRKNKGFPYHLRA